MKIMMARAWSVFAQLSLLGCPLAHGLPADLRMLSLIPPQSEIVVGIVPESTSHIRSFVLFTLANRIDFEDFLSLASVEPSLRIDQLIFTAAAGSSVANAEHSVIVSGRLRADRIYGSFGHLSGAKDYRGVLVLMVPPLSRERAYFVQDRMLAIIGSNLAIFGTPLIVRDIIDRFLDRTAADPFIVRRVSLLNNADDSWYLVRSTVRGAEFVGALKKLDATLNEAGGTEELLFGIRCGKQVEIEYLINANPNYSGSAVQRAEATKMFRDGGDSPVTELRVLRVGRGRFEEWLKQVAGQ